MCGAFGGKAVLVACDFFLLKWKNKFILGGNMKKGMRDSWVRLDGEDVKIVYKGVKEKVYVKMWFEGKDREYVFEGELKFVGFKMEDDDE